MEKKKSKIWGILKYVGKTLSLTLLTMLIIIGLALLFVFVSAKVAKSKNAEPPINLYTIISPSMIPNINVYDVVVTIKTDLSKLKEGDVISYYSDQPGVNGMTITHRIVQKSHIGDEFLFRTKGDYNKEVDSWVVNGKDVVGKVIFKVPQLGKVQFFLGSKGGWLIAILIPALAIIAYDIYKIIKLVLIKQKIIAYQKAEDIPKENIELGTVTDVYDTKEENIQINSINNLSEYEKKSDIQDEFEYEGYDKSLNSESHNFSTSDASKETDNEYKENIITIDDDNVINSLDEQIKVMNEWKDKIDDKK